MRAGLKYFLWLLIGAAVVWAVLASADTAGQRKLFFAEGNEELYDYWMPRMCLEQGYKTAKCVDWDMDDKDAAQLGYPPEEEGCISLSGWYRTRSGARLFITGSVDKVYPAFALLPLKFFPQTRGGAYCWTIFAGLLFLASLVLCARSRDRRIASCFWPLAFACSMPFIFNFERGNPVWLSAAAVGVFLAWWNSDSPCRRRWAAIGLGVAAVLKIAPAVLGVLYLAEWFTCSRVMDEKDVRAQRRQIGIDIAWSAGTAIVLFFGAWLFVPEKFAALPMMLQNAAHHADTVRRQADFGLIALWRAVRIFFGQDIRSVWSGMIAVWNLSQLGGAAVLLWGAWKRDYLLLIGGMLLAAGNMYYYAALYLLPVFVLQCPAGLLRLALWFTILCPLQLVVAGHSGNVVLCNLSLYALLALHLVRSAKVRAYET